MFIIYYAIPPSLLVEILKSTSILVTLKLGFDKRNYKKHAHIPTGSRFSLGAKSANSCFTPYEKYRLLTNIMATGMRIDDVIKIILPLALLLELLKQENPLTW